MLALVFGPEWLFELLLNDVETSFFFFSFFLFSFVFVSSGALSATFDCPRASISSNLVTTGCKRTSSNLSGNCEVCSWNNASLLMKIRQQF